MGMKELAEGIILQSIEDLSDPYLREDCIHFFKGDGSSRCSEIEERLNAYRSSCTTKAGCRLH